MLMILLMLLAVGMLSLSTVSLRSSNTDSATNRARANARMALMIAIGELQKEMGPDMRISAEAAIHDTNPATEKIDGIAQPHWLAVYDSWGNFLNGEYTPEGKSTAEVRTIADTYVAKRAPMFRRWLVSLPENLQNDIHAAESGLSEEKSVLMVGEGTLGAAYANSHPENMTRAFKIPTHGRGSYAWWISPENHKAKIGLASQKRNLTTDQWATAQGVSSELGIGGINGLEKLDDKNPGANSMATRVISFKTLEIASENEAAAKATFFNLTEESTGVLSNTRNGGLKKDLSLLFENSDTTIAPQYTQANRFAPEPSIRPHSKDVLAENAVLPRRPFTSWTQLRHYYRTYRTDTDTALRVLRGIDGQPERNLKYARNVPYTQIHTPNNMREYDKDLRWFGEGAYQRHPIIVRYLLIHSYRTLRYFEPRTNSTQTILMYYDVPVVTVWNPYTTPLVIPNRSWGVSAASYSSWPHRLYTYRADGRLYDTRNGAAIDTPIRVASKDDSSDIYFQPGEFKTFSLPKGAELRRREEDVNKNPLFCLKEGFDPSGVGGVTDGGAYYWKRIPSDGNGEIDDLKFDIKFYGNQAKNADQGNTPGSLTLKTGKNGDWKDDGNPPHYQIDFFQVANQEQSIVKDELGSLQPLIEVDEPLPVAYSMLTLKSLNRLSSPAPWMRDWRSRNWLHAPPYYFGSALYMSEQSEARAHTQRLDSPYEVSFGPTSPSELMKLTGELNGRPWLGFGPNPYEKVTAVPALELPTAPISSLASFSGMRISPGWIWPKDLDPRWHVRQRISEISDQRTLFGGGTKIHAYQSGITGGGIGNSFIHPMIPRKGVYFNHDNSVSQDLAGPVDTKAYCDYWDHALVLNDALWDEYFISSLADQTRPWASEADNLQANVQKLIDNKPLPISRYQFNGGGLENSKVKEKLLKQDAYLHAAEHLMVDGAFNVNSTSVNAWYALFKGIRERKLFYRDTTNGTLREVTVPQDKIALSRFDTATVGKETADLSTGIDREDGHYVWSDVRFLDDDQIRLLAEKCVEQVKRRGPFLNFSEFINRRLEESELGLMGALQSAIDYDDANPQPDSINYKFKSTSMLNISPSNLGTTEYPTPEAVKGSRLAGVPGYVIQSDLLKPIANTLQVRDDTFRIRAYGEALDTNGKVTARAWCEAIIQRNPEYVDSSNDNNEPNFIYKANSAGGYDPKWDGEFVPNANLSPTNRIFGRKLEIKSFRCLAYEEI